MIDAYGEKDKMDRREKCGDERLCDAGASAEYGRPMRTAAPAVAFIGYRNSGKTTLVEKVIAELTARGVRVGSVKHHGHHGFDIDTPGKDSWRHAQAGSRHVALICGNRYAEYAETAHEMPLADMLARFDDVDMVIVEGYKTAGLPNVVVAREGIDRARDGNSLDLVDAGTLAVACDDALASAVPQGVRAVSVDDAGAVADVVQEAMCGDSGRRRPTTCSL